MTLTDLPPIRARYFQRVRNVGDAVAPDVLSAMTGRAVYASRSDDAHHILSIGSMLQTATPKTFIWGTGLIHPDAGSGQILPAQVLAVRGKRTYEEVKRRGAHLADIPLGDPGILLPPFSKSGPKRFRLGLVPHYVDRAHPFFVAAAKDPSIAVLDVCGSIETFFATLAVCECVASSSLHGLIFAEALGHPTLWLDVSGKVIGNGFKFHDWFSLALNPQLSSFQPKGAECVDEIVRRAEPRDVQIDRDALAAALTSEVIEACSLPKGKPAYLIPTRSCREQPLPVFVLCRTDAAGLRHVLAELASQSTAIRPIICDDRSDDSVTRELITHFENVGVSSARRPDGSTQSVLDWLNCTITDFFETWAEPSRFALIVCDARFRFASPHRVADYDELLDGVPSVERVSSLDDIGDAEENDSDLVTLNIGLESFEAYDGVIVSDAVERSFALYRSGQRLGSTMLSLLVRPAGSASVSHADDRGNTLVRPSAGTSSI